MPKAIPILILSTLLGLVMALWGWGEASEARGLLKTETELRVAAEGRLSKVQSNLRTVESNNATTRLRLEQVLSTLPDRNTPPAVYNELCSRGKCAKVDSVSTPGH
ncbi:hypothetical protein FDH02_gp33 [Pseudomonas phage VSW-3]|uniref:Uncharacterized protein n=1 Tax=Pseudomonas phage VSW-3 TaxID=1852562 RepID=A0A173GDI1_9CAUD|nr:hypothetical protein FDH02_gp33 [Pseudomonas phage VSW-3]ANH51109.1 hypothetical protein VSW3_33 [Pseudomonas phage VSW-3]